jgi:hypothetical protein
MEYKFYKEKAFSQSVRLLASAWIRKGCCFVICTAQWMQRHNIWFK